MDPIDSSVLGAALRETREEVGLDLNPAAAKLFDLDIHDIPGTQTAPQHSHFDIRYLFVVQQRNLTVGSDVADAKWITFDEWQKLEVDSGLRRVRRKLESS